MATIIQMILIIATGVLNGAIHIPALAAVVPIHSVLIVI